MFREEEEEGRREKTKVPSFLSSHGSSRSTHDHTLQHPVNSSGKQQLAILSLALSLSVRATRLLSSRPPTPAPSPSSLAPALSDREHTSLHLSAHRFLTKTKIICRDSSSLFHPNFFLLPAAFQAAKQLTAC